MTNKEIVSVIEKGGDLEKLQEIKKQLENTGHYGLVDIMQEMCRKDMVRAIMDEDYAAMLDYLKMYIR